MKTANVRCAARHSRARAQAKAPRPPRRRSPTPKRAYKNTARQSEHMRPGPVRPGRIFCCRFSATTSPRCTVERKRAFAAGSGRSGMVFNPQKMQRAAGRTPFCRGGAFAAQGRALCLTQPGPPFCLPAHRLPPLPARRPVHAAARRSAVVVVFALCGQESGGDQQCQRLGHHNGKPDAVQPDEGRQRQHHGHLKYERAQK